MYIKCFFLICITLVCCVILGRICYLMFIKRYKPREESCPVKTMIILGSGGHTAEMLRIIKHLNFKNYSPRVYIHAQTDRLSAEKVRDLENGNKDYKIMAIYRSREVRQSYLTSIWTTILSILNCFPILWKENPELILCNGPGTCIPLCGIAFLFKVLCITQSVTVFIESFCRVKTFSLTGRILYYLADYIIVQWAYLSKPIYNRNDLQKMTHSTSMVTVPWESLTEELGNIPIEIRLHLIPIINVLCASDKQLTSEKWISVSITRVEACLDRTWEVLNSGYWKDVRIEYRYCYSLCIVVKAVLLELQCEVNAENFTDKEKKRTALKNIINQIDRGILLGAPLPSVPNLLTAIAAKLNNYCTEESGTINMEEISINYEEINNLISNCPDRYFEKPSMQTFYNKIFKPKLPGILTDCMNHWKALTSWKNPDYLIKIAGSRTVPIEIGSRYTDEDWTQHLINFSEFLQKHVIANNSEVGYLAQHQLFEQIPELKEDFEIPEYCCFSDSEENDVELSGVDINAWFGPAGTVSPLHFDPKNNLLSQVFGYKRVILYSPTETDNLYPYDTRLLNNTAQVDPIRPDYDKWPNFRNAKGITFYLKPGEILFIPPKWWHHVTALTPSFSISFWWS